MALALDQTELLQFPHKSGSPIVAALEEFLHIFLDEVNKDPVQAVDPAVLSG